MRGIKKAKLSPLLAGITMDGVEKLLSNSGKKFSGRAGDGAPSSKDVKIVTPDSETFPFVVVLNRSQHKALMEKMGLVKEKFSVTTLADALSKLVELVQV